MNAPDGTGAVGAAVTWIQNALLGTAATTVAIVAVASIGFLMLTGRVELRRAARVVLGCFIIFGASTIAAGIQSAVSDAGPVQVARPEAYYAPSPSAPPPGYDPYAGAAPARH